MPLVAIIAALAIVLPAGLAGERTIDLRLSEICDPAAERKPTDKVPSLRDCDLDYPSPDGQIIARVAGSNVSVIRGGRILPAATIDYGRIIWNPDSTGFVVADTEGSGQSEVVIYVDAVSVIPRRLTALRETALSRFAELNGCQGSTWYANTITDGWDAPGEVRLVVQEGVHSEGCRTRGDMIGVVGDPRSGRILSVLTAAQVQDTWCTPAENRSFGYCYVEIPDRRQ